MESSNKYLCLIKHLTLRRHVISKNLFVPDAKTTFMVRNHIEWCCMNIGLLEKKMTAMVFFRHQINYRKDKQAQWHIDIYVVIFSTFLTVLYLLNAVKNRFKKWLRCRNNFCVHVSVLLHTACYTLKHCYHATT